jgi:hypothetical protein
MLPPFPPKHSGPPQADNFWGILDKTLNTPQAENVLDLFCIQKILSSPSNFFTSPDENTPPHPPPRHMPWGIYSRFTWQNKKKAQPFDPKSNEL